MTAYSVANAAASALTSTCIDLATSLPGLVLVADIADDTAREERKQPHCRQHDR